MTNIEDRKLRYVFTMAAVLVVALVVLVIAAARGESAVLPSITVEKTIRAPEGTVHQVGTIDVPAEHVGQECGVSVTAANNASVHPGSALIVTSGDDSVTIPDVESAPGATITASEQLTVGATVVVSAQIGPDGVFSGGATIVTVDCPDVPPPTTVPPTEPPTADHEPPPTTVAPPAECVDNPATAADECATLPRTGPSTGSMLLISLGALIFGLGVVALRVGRNGSVR